ncbi:MAG: hypothetical protein HZB98_02375 [Bacteroidia bacterium]|nr:hypothetical protein [Bacteroidia bacterium]
MKKIVPGIIILSALIVLTKSCAMKTETIEPYLIKIDSLYAPDTVNVKYVFNVELFGIVGPNKCYAFEKAYQTTTDQNEIVIEAWGKYSYYGDPCLEGEVLMNAKFEMSVAKPGVYNIKGVQPNGYYYERKLVVK